MQRRCCFVQPVVMCTFYSPSRVSVKRFIMRNVSIAFIVLLGVTFSHEIVFKANASSPINVTRPINQPRPGLRPPRPPNNGSSWSRPIPVPIPVPIPWTTRKTTARPKVCTTDTECGYRQFCRNQRCRRGPTGTGVSCSPSIIPSTCGVNRTCVEYECSCLLNSHCRSGEACDGLICKSKSKSGNSSTPIIVFGCLGGLLLLSVIIGMFVRRSN